jgi:nitrite reductase (NADH) small subunit
MVGFTIVGVKREFNDREPRNIAVGALNVVVVRIDEAVFAFENNCPHQHFSLLHQGVIEDCTLTCPMHGWTFDLRSGESTSGNGRLRGFEVRISEGSVWIENRNKDQSFALFE